MSNPINSAPAAAFRLAAMCGLAATVACSIQPTANERQHGPAEGQSPPQG